MKGRFHGDFPPHPTAGDPHYTQNYYNFCEKELDLLRKEFFVTTPGAGYCAAITGPNDIGKTELIKHAAKRFEETPHPNVYYFPTQIVAESSYWTFWSILICDFSDQITEENLHAAPNPDPYYIEQIKAAYEFFGNIENQNQIGTRGYHNHAIRHLNKIFRAYTEPMRKYFRSFDAAETLKSSFEYLNDCRNCFAHNNAKVLDEHSCSRLRELCSKLIRDFEEGEQNIPLKPVKKMPTASKVSEAPMPTLQQIEALLNSKEPVVFCYQEKKQPKGNLRGVIKGCGFSASISKLVLSDFGTDFSPQIGDEFNAIVARWDSNAGLFNLIAP